MRCFRCGGPRGRYSESRTTHRKQRLAGNQHGPNVIPERRGISATAGILLLLQCRRRIHGRRRRPPNLRVTQENPQRFRVRCWCGQGDMSPSACAHGRFGIRERGGRGLTCAWPMYPRSGSAHWGSAARTAVELEPMRGRTSDESPLRWHLPGECAVARCLRRGRECGTGCPAGISEPGGSTQRRPTPLKLRVVRTRSDLSRPGERNERATSCCAARAARRTRSWDRVCRAGRETLRAASRSR